jgi:ABC-2 type transport system permease protein
MILDAVRAEWGKTWSLRSTFLCLAGAFGLICATAWTLANDFLYGLAHGDPTAGTTMRPIDAVAPAVQFGLLLIAAFAMLPVTSEYASGSIRSTLQAEPRRRVMLAAKTVVSASSAAVAAFATVAAAGGIVRLTLGDHAEADASDPATAARAGLIVLVNAVIVVGLAAVVRHSVGALALSFVLFVATLALPPGVAVWAPSGASAAFLTDDSTSYPAVVGLVVTAAWALGVYAAGALVLRRRDA